MGSIWTMLILFLVVQFSCKNDLEINAPYKETFVIYGLLDINADTQFIKINKAFLTDEQSVKEVALVPDSVYFKELKAELIEEGNGKKIPLLPIAVNGKQAGQFITNPNILYYTAEKLNKNGTYKIVAENLKTNKSAQSSTVLVGNAGIFGPAAFFDNEFTLGAVNSVGLGVNLVTGANAYAYDVIMNFEYEEFYKFDTAVKTTKTITWKMLDAAAVNPSSRFLTNLSSELFYDLLTARIDVRKDWIRRAKSFSFTYVGGGKELINYISVSKPSIGIVQKQTDYTNIQNGFGVFSSRNFITVGPLPPSASTKASLATTGKTATLGF